MRTNRRGLFAFVIYVPFLFLIFFASVSQDVDELRTDLNLPFVMLVSDPANDLARFHNVVRSARSGISGCLLDVFYFVYNSISSVLYNHCASLFTPVVTNVRTCMMIKGFINRMCHCAVICTSATRDIWFKWRSKPHLFENHFGGRDRPDPSDVVRFLFNSMEGDSSADMIHYGCPYTQIGWKMVSRYERREEELRELSDQCVIGIRERSYRERQREGAFREKCRFESGGFERGRMEREVLMKTTQEENNNNRQENNDLPMLIFGRRSQWDGEVFSHALETSRAWSGASSFGSLVQTDTSNRSRRRPDLTMTV